jgi:hypothetical protein
MIFLWLISQKLVLPGRNGLVLDFCSQLIDSITIYCSQAQKSFPEWFGRIAPELLRSVATAQTSLFITSALGALISGVFECSHGKELILRTSGHARSEHKELNAC